MGICILVYQNIGYTLNCTYCGDGMCSPKLVDGSVEDRYGKDERPICKVYEKSRRTPYWTRELNTSGPKGGEEVFQVKPGF